MFDVREEDDLFMLLFVLFVRDTPNEDGEDDTFELLAGEAIIDGLAARLLPSPRTRTLLLLLAFTRICGVEYSGDGVGSSLVLEVFFFFSSSLLFVTKEEEEEANFFFFTEEEG
jgi:hypothetical protein